MKIIKKIATILKNVIIGYAFYTFPVTLIGVFIIAGGKGPPSDGVLLKKICLILDVQSCIWTLTSLFLSILMLFSRSVRDSILQKITGIKERDEREVQIAGKALKSSYLTTMTILLFLLVISLFHLEISEKSADSVEVGQHRGTVGLLLNFKAFDSDGIVTQKEGYDSYFHLNFMPISGQALIILLLLWQTISYRFVVRRSFKIPD